MTREELDEVSTRVACILKERGIWVSLDGRVYAETVCEIVDRAMSTVRAWRSNPDHPLKYVRGTRPTYELWRVFDYVYNIGVPDEVDA